VVTQIRFESASVGTATRLRVGRPRFDSQQRLSIFLLALSFHTGSGTHPYFYPIATGGSFPRRKTAEGVKLYLHSPICLHGVVLS